MTDLHSQSKLVCAGTITHTIIVRRFVHDAARTRETSLPPPQSSLIEKIAGTAVLQGEDSVEVWSF